ncbi:hypothetical protein KDC22_04620 [Paenibacillus tritici]|uniref:TolB family protein n=1 Tax=Paenibacillus tritici TaxID=1873425 RepID=UPI001BABFDB0|nr:hypothetical protein [Paenibacillus tritici]QUL55838.1 hypothetical protein KDC22_04620 [Paenibacillus tritici]
MNTRTLKLALVPALLMTLVACSSEQGGNAAVSPKPESSPAPVEASAQPTAAPEATPAPSEAAGIVVGDIREYKDIAINDWKEDTTVVVSKENDKLGPMSLEEMSGAYPHSLYFYHLDTGEYELIKEKKNTMLGDARLSPDNLYLLYSEFSLGDPVYHVMDLGSKKTFSFTGDTIAGAMGASWADKDTVVGPAYSGGAYTASTSGKIAPVEGLSGEGLIVVKQIKDKMYYTSNANEALQTLDLNTKEKATLPVDPAGSVIPSPDEEQLLILQYKENTQTLLLSDADGKNQRTLVEGAELGALSWSPDQRLIVYSVALEENGTTNNTLYVYDLSSDKSVQIAESSGTMTTSWSPSSKQLSYTEWSEGGNSSSIVQLK